MEISDTCPKCGAKKNTFNGQCSWECGSYQTYVPGLNPYWAHMKSAHCECRQELEQTKALWRQAVDDANRCADELRATRSELAQSTNYVANHDTFPTAIWFANGRKVWIELGGHIGVGMADKLALNPLEAPQ